MAKFKIVVSDPSTGKSQVVEVEGAKAQPFVGHKIGDAVDGLTVGIPGSKLAITGGVDKDGTPMRGDVHGGVRLSVILSGGTGFHPRRKGERQRKNVRGNTITEDIAQVNAKVLGKSEKSEGKPR
jgi:small subunit ribosomal protein S6e